jgi:hypothetical protein
VDNVEPEVPVSDFDDGGVDELVLELPVPDQDVARGEQVCLTYFPIYLTYE